MSNKFQSAVLLFFILLLSNNLSIFAQSSYLPMGRDDYQWLDRLSIRDGKIPEDFNTFNKTYDRKLMLQYISALDSNNIDSSGAKWSKVDEQNVQYLYNDNFEYAGEKAMIDGTYPIFNSIYKYKTDFYAYQDGNFVLKLNPVIFYQGGHSTSSSEYKYINTKGVELKGNILNKIGFYSYFTDNQMKAPDYVENYITQFHAVPGNGYYKQTLPSTKVDYFDARGYFTFSAAKYLHFAFGQDKMFWGDGIRSLFLADGTASYPFLRMNFHYKKFDYENLYMQFTKQYLSGSGDHLYEPKYAVMHNLSYNVAENFQLGLFESVIFSRNNGYDPAYLNPIIFYREVEQSRGSPDNAAMGMMGKWNLLHHFQLYGQFYLDDFNYSIFKTNHNFWGEKYAMQAGLKYVDVLGIKNLDAQVEANLIRPFVYSHGDSLANFVSYNQPLAHPMGANLVETIFKIYFQPLQKLSFNFTASLVKQGLDSTKTYNGKPSDFGSNPMVGNILRNPIYNDTYTLGEGVNTHFVIADLSMSWQVSHNIFIDFNFIYRKESSSYVAYNKDEKFFGIGFRMNTSRPKFLF